MKMLFNFTVKTNSLTFAKLHCNCRRHSLTMHCVDSLLTMLPKSVVRSDAGLCHPPRVNWQKCFCYQFSWVADIAVWSNPSKYVNASEELSQKYDVQPSSGYWLPHFGWVQLQDANIVEIRNAEGFQLLFNLYEFTIYSHLLQAEMDCFTVNLSTASPASGHASMSPYTFSRQARSGNSLQANQECTQRKSCSFGPWIDWLILSIILCWNYDQLTSSWRWPNDSWWGSHLLIASKQSARISPPFSCMPFEFCRSLEYLSSAGQEQHALRCSIWVGWVQEYKSCQIGCQIHGVQDDFVDRCSLLTNPWFYMFKTIGITNVLNGHNVWLPGCGWHGNPAAYSSGRRLSSSRPFMSV